MNEEINKRIDEAFETLKSHCVSLHKEGKWNVILHKSIYDAMTQEERMWYYNTHIDQDTYFLNDMFDDYIYKLKKNGSLRKIKRVYNED